MRPEREGGLLILLAGLVYGMWPPAAPERTWWLLAWVVFSAGALIWLRSPGRGAAAEVADGRQDPARDWAVHIAHDFRTPLMRLRLHIEGAQAEEALAPASAVAMATEVLQLERLADGLIDLTADAGSLADAQGDTDLSAAAAAMVDRLGPLFEMRARGIVCAASPGCRAAIAETAAERVLSNLLSNALRYARGAGEVTLGVEDDGPFYVRLVITNPAARPQAPLEALRKPFVRGASGAGEPGFGLGLAVVERLVHLAGGRLHLAYDDMARTFSAAVVIPRAHRLRDGG